MRIDGFVCWFDFCRAGGLGGLELEKVLDFFGFLNCPGRE